jgi:magnesium-transporting ATPase (P-type)
VITTGEEFFKLPHERQLSLLRSGNKVFARTQPSDKQKLIAMLSALGETTAMTGDGMYEISCKYNGVMFMCIGCILRCK